MGAIEADPLRQPIPIPDAVEKNGHGYEQAQDTVVKSEWDAGGFDDNESDGDDEEKVENRRVETRLSKEVRFLSSAQGVVHEKTGRTQRTQPQTIPHVAQQRVLPIVLSLPVANDSVTLKSIKQLPLETRKNLEQRFEAMYLAQEDRTVNYNRVLKNPKAYMDKPVCFRDLILHSRTASTHGSLFKKTGKVCADERCNKARDPCMHLFMHNKVPSLCLVPLPEVDRIGKAWTEFTYWVRY